MSLQLRICEQFCCARKVDNVELSTFAKVPWPKERGPSYWEDRLTAHYKDRGVRITEAYTRHGRMHLTLSLMRR